MIFITKMKILKLSVLLCTTIIAGQAAINLKEDDITKTALQKILVATKLIILK